MNTPFCMRTCESVCACARRNSVMSTYLIPIPNIFVCFWLLCKACNSPFCILRVSLPHISCVFFFFFLHLSFQEFSAMRNLKLISVVHSLCYRKYLGHSFCFVPALISAIWFICTDDSVTLRPLCVCPCFCDLSARTFFTNSHYSYVFWAARAEGKAIPVTGRGGQKDCETPRPRCFLDQWPSTWGNRRHLRKAWVRERIMLCYEDRPTERPPLVGEVSANFCE
jgi:hypothetical protein